MATTAIVFSLIGRDRASAVFRQVGRSAGRLSSTSSKVGAAMAKSLEVGALAVGGVAVASLKTAGDFEKSMNRVKAVSQATGKDFTMLRDQAKQMGRTTAFSAKEAADAQGNLAMAGLTTKQVYKALPSVIALASTEQMGLADAASIATNVMTGYGKTVGDLSHITDVLAKASINTNAGVSSIGEAMKYAAPVAQKAGIKFEQATAAIGLMSNAGIQGSMAGTALRGAITRLLAPTKQVQGRLDKLGVSVRTANGKLLPLDDIIDQLGKHGATTGDLMTIFGQRAGPAMAALVQKGKPALDKLTKQLQHSGGTAEKVAKVQMAGLQGQLKRLKGAWEDLLIEIGDTGLIDLATKAVTGVTTATSGLANWINTDGIPAVKHFGSTVSDMVPVKKIKHGVGEVKKVVGDFFKGLAGPKKQKQKLPTPLLKQPAIPSGLIPPAPPKSDAEKLGKQIRDAISGGIENLDWSKVGDSVGRGLGTAFQWITKNGAKLTKQLGVAIGSVDWVDVGKQTGRIALPAMIGFVNSFFEPLFHKEFWKDHFWDTVLAVLSVIPFGKLGSVLGKFGSKIAASRLFEGIGAQLSRMSWTKIIPFSEKLNEAVGPSIRAVKGWVGRMATGFRDAFSSRFPRVSQFISDQLTRLPSRLGDLGRLLRRKGGELITRLGDGLISRIPGMNNRFVRYLLKVFGRFTLWQIGVNLAKSLLSGMANVLSDVGTWLKEHLVDPVVNWTKDLFGIHSPSTVFLAIGAALVAGLKGGIVGAAKGIGKWLGSRVVSPVTSRFAKAGSWLYGRGKSLVSGLLSGAGKSASGIPDWLTKHVKNPTVDRFKLVSTWLHSKGGSLISGLIAGTWDWLKAKGHSFKDWALKIKGAIVDAIVDAFDIGSPSRVMMQYGGWIMAGLQKGMLRSHDALKSVAKSVFKSPLEAAEAMFKNGANLGSKWLAKVGGALGLGDSSAKGSAQQFAQLALKSYGWGPSEWPALKALWNGESGWNPRATNASSGAYGIAQALPASKMASAGSDWKTNAATQIKWGLGYIKGRYGSPTNAYSQWLSRSPHWYAKGAGGAAPGWAWVGEKGPELINLKGGETILSHADSVAAARANGIKLPGYASGTVANAQAKVNKAKKDLALAQERRYGIQAAKTRLKAAQQELANAKRRTRGAVDNAITNGFKKTLTTGTASAIASTIKSMVSKLQNAGASKAFINGILHKSEKLQALANKKAAVTSKIAQAKAFAADQSSNVKDFLSISGTSATSIDDLVTQMKTQQKTAGDFASLTKTLKTKGASADLLAQLAEAGPGSQLATVLQGATVTDVSRLNSLMTSGSKLADAFGKTMADSMYDSGKHAGEGFLAGLKAQEKDLQKQMNKLAGDLIKAIKKKFKIKSPSRVMRDQVGKQIALGTAVGIADHVPHVTAAAQRMADAAVGISTHRVVIPSPAGTAASRQDEATQLLAQAVRNGSLTPVVHVHFDDDRLKDLIDIRVEPQIKASEKEQAYRAKVGRRH